MLSIASAACSSFDHGTQPSLFSALPDLEIPSLIFGHKSELITCKSNQTSPNSLESNHGSYHSTEPVQIEPVELDLELNELKLRRMKSNRESARRSRIRKQKHLDDLRTETIRLNLTNREISNRLRFVLQRGLTIRSENQRLQAEHTMLSQRLIELQNMMIFRQIHHQMNNRKNNNVGGFGEVMMTNEPMGF